MIPKQNVILRLEYQPRYSTLIVKTNTYRDDAELVSAVIAKVNELFVEVCRDPVTEHDADMEADKGSYTMFLITLNQGFVPMAVPRKDNVLLSLDADIL